MLNLWNNSLITRVHIGLNYSQDDTAKKSSIVSKRKLINKRKNVQKAKIVLLKVSIMILGTWNIDLSASLRNENIK